MDHCASLTVRGSIQTILTPISRRTIKNYLRSEAIVRLAGVKPEEITEASIFPQGNRLDPERRIPLLHRTGVAAGRRRWGSILTMSSNWFG
jgi:hypothetical protein